MDIYDLMVNDNSASWRPLAQRQKPKQLGDFVGQEHIFRENSLLRKMIATDRMSSIILYGPPGTGKTSIAEIIAYETKSNFIRINAVTAGIAEIKEAINQAKSAALYSKKTIVFIDEIHRFNKKQQDALLPHVEDGLITLIGATTENPYFEVNSALISRVSVFRLEPLERYDIAKIVKKALAEDEEIRQVFSSVTEEALDIIYRYSSGDARKALNLIENCSISANDLSVLDEGILQKNMGLNPLRYDRDGDMHYDVISAFIKSIRGSDPDAALHYLARMLEAGEDPMFIARRIVISASEDIGNADPTALILAIAAKDAVHFVGLPEARIALAQAVTYLASSPKSNRSYLGIDAALDDVRKGNIGEVPNHLKDASYRGAENFGHGKGYKYSHDYEGAYVPQQYLPDKLIDKKYYKPTKRGREARLYAYLEEIEKISGAKNVKR